MAKALQRTPEDAEVGIRELREHLSRYLAEAAEGASVTVTDRGRPVARLIPVDQVPPGLQRLIDAGLVSTPAGRATSARSWRRPKAKLPVADLVAEQRR